MNFDEPLALLSKESPASFIRDYWQKKPILSRAAIDCTPYLITPDELAGLACEEDFESRLAIFSEGKWSLEHGPFCEDRFASLPPKGWTLLVQDVDKFLPQVAQLLGKFWFLPQWRLDDVMISFAPEGGSVGAHLDNYDVFLVQARGKRRWLYESSTRSCDEEELVDGPIRLLSNFVPKNEALLSPGDILYLPPRVAHHGISESSDCMTYSVGFRAPPYKELIGYYMQHRVNLLSDVERYQDHSKLGPEDRHCLTENARTTIRDALQPHTLLGLDFDRWLAGYLTQPKYEFERESEFSFGPESRLLYFQNKGSTYLYIDGEELVLEGSWQDQAEALCQSRSFDPESELGQLLRKKRRTPNT